MKKINYLSFLVMFLGLTANGFAQISCPGIPSVLPFILQVTPVPFPQCAYLGNATHVHSQVNHCKQVGKKLTKRFSQKLENWNCNFSAGKKYGGYNYFFYFAPFKSQGYK